MKRCNNCGWTNNDNPARCDKCNHLLAVVISEPEVEENVAENPEGKEPELAQTVMGKQASDDFLDKQNVFLLLRVWLSQPERFEKLPEMQPPYP